MMLNRLSLISIGLLLTIVLAGCKTGTTSDTDITPPQGTEQLISLSKSDLAQRLNITEAEIKLVSIEAVNFSDTSLGVPEPGKFYAQVVTPGYIIKLEAKGQAYQYNTDEQDRVVPYLDEVTFPVEPGEIDDGKPWVPVD